MSPDFTSFPTKLRFIVLTCRDPRHDFRLSLVQALRRRCETYSVWLRRRPLISGPDDSDPPREVSLAGLLRFMRGLPRDDRLNVYLNSTNTYFPTITTVLRQVAAPGIWCFDMHDDLRYHNRGLKRWREGMVVSALCRQSHVVVHAAESLQELFPASVHLGNASHMESLDLTGASWQDILVIASFDDRFDFDFMSRLASLAPDLRFHLHGWASHDDPDTKRRLQDLDGRHSNIHYHGPYTTAELPGVLGAYRISVAPYVASSFLTRYIDPLRFYHCLNAGLEVVSTEIPQATAMRDSLHVVSDPAACLQTLRDIRAGVNRKQGGYRPITWQQRADRLIDIIEALPRTRRSARAPVAAETV